MPLPSYHLALVVSKDGRATLEQQPIPSPSDYEILVRVRAISIKPHSWKEYLRSRRSAFTNGGSDSFTGDVVAIGKGLINDRWYVGQSVTGDCRYAAIQEYIAISPRSFLPLYPDKSWLPYDAAPPMAGYSLCLIVKALHHRLAMSFELTSPEPLFIWDGSSGIGRYAVQLACLAGYKVVTTAHEHTRGDAFSAGAAAVFSYSYPALISRVRTWARREGGGPLRKALDTMCTPGTIERCMSILEEGGELVTLDPIREDLVPDCPGVRATYVFDPPHPGDIEERECIEEWNRRMPAYLQSGKLPKSVVPMKVFRGGISDLPRAVEFIKMAEDPWQDLVVTMA